MAEIENRSTHKVYEKDKLGEVQIADEVVAIIAGLAATEVEGVDSMAGNITNELVGKLGMKNLSKGVKVDVTEEHVSVDLSLNLKYGHREHDRPFRAGREHQDRQCEHGERPLKDGRAAYVHTGRYHLEGQAALQYLRRPVFFSVKCLRSLAFASIVRYTIQKGV